MEPKKLSIVIVTYNSEKDIFDCIASIYKYADLPKEDYEIIIVDNNSRDTLGMFSKIKTLYGTHPLLLRNDRNGGYGQGNNIGIEHASAPVILIMNPDVRLMEPVFRVALKAFDNDPLLTVYGMKQMLSATKASNNSFACTYMTNGYLFTLLTAVCSRLDLYLPRYMYISGACFFLRRAPFVEIGMFDESVFLYGEEDDIRYRLMQKFGAHFAYNKRLHYMHLTLDREHTIDYDKRLLDVAVSHAVKKGYPVHRMLRNRLQNTRMLLVREWLRMRLKGKDPKAYNRLTALYQYIKSKM